MSRRLSFLLLSSALACAEPKDEPQAAQVPTLAEARAFYAAQPRYLRPLPYTAVPKGLTDLRSETCGLCHTEIYAEWKISTHARAFRGDAQYLAELEKSATPESDVSWMCVNCHTPLENQLERLVAGLQDGKRDRPIYVKNPSYDPQLAENAIGCATCHVREGKLLGPFGEQGSPHGSTLEPALRTVEICTQCHQAVAEFPELRLACTFNTGQELAESRYAEGGMTCQGCHMPEIERRVSIADTLPMRKTRRHWFGGSLIPKRPDFAAEVKPLEKVYSDGLTVRWRELPARLKARRAVTLSVELENTNAGHLLPTGDPERYLTVRAEVQDARGELLAEKEERIGAVYEWWPAPKKVSDNRLRPGEKRSFELRFTAPKKGRVWLRLQASKWRISQENMSHHQLAGKYVPGRRFLDAEQTLDVR